MASSAIEVFGTREPVAVALPESNRAGRRAWSFTGVPPLVIDTASGLILVCSAAWLTGCAFDLKITNLRAGAIGLTAVASYAFSRWGFGVRRTIGLAFAAIGLICPSMSALIGAGPISVHPTGILAWVDRRAALGPSLQGLPQELTTGDACNYLGCSLIFLWAWALWPRWSTNRLAGGLALLLFSSIWFLNQSIALHAQLRRLFVASLIERHIQPAALNRLGLEVIPLLALSAILYLGCMAAFRGSRAVTLPGVVAAGIVTMLWWGLAPSFIPSGDRAWPYITACARICIIVAGTSLAAFGLDCMLNNLRRPAMRILIACATIALTQLDLTPSLPMLTFIQQGMSSSHSTRFSASVKRGSAPG